MNNPPPFKVGHKYTRTQIHNAIGGSEEEYLPHVDNKVVAVCVRPDGNPHAPIELLGGKPPTVEHWARTLTQQGGTFPVFLKEATNEWRYEGRYIVVAWTDDPSVLTIMEQTYGRDVSIAIYLHRVSD